MKERSIYALDVPSNQSGFSITAASYSFVGGALSRELCPGNCLVGYQIVEVKDNEGRWSSRSGVIRSRRTRREGINDGELWRFRRSKDAGSVVEQESGYRSRVVEVQCRQDSNDYRFDTGKCGLGVGMPGLFG